MLILYQLAKLYSSEVFMPIFIRSHLKVKDVFVLSIILISLFSSRGFSYAVPDEVQAVFDNNGCDVCHSDANPTAGLSLENATTSEIELVGVTAMCSNANDELVLAGNVNESVLHQKLAGQNIVCGGQMPPQNSGALISAVDLAVIDNWIISIGPAQQFGLMTLQNNSIDVNEDQPEIVLTVNRELGNQGIVTVDFVASRIAGDSAENGTDFTETSGTLTFVDGETSQQITVPLIDDNIFEGTEVFTVQLNVGSESGGAVIGEPSLTKVNIIDDELDVNPGTFLFSAVSYNVDENVANGIIEITILRAFGATGEVSVNYSTSDSGAMSGSDYQTTSGTLIFPEGDKSETFTIIILDDEIEEENEFFNLSLNQPAGGAVLGSPSSVQINITDNDVSTGDDGGGGDGGGSDGGDDGNTGGSDNTGNSGGVDIVATENVEFETAGSFNYLLLFLLVLLILSRGFDTLALKN